MRNTQEKTETLKRAMAVMNWPKLSENSFSASLNIKKRYHELAFRFHPDKKGDKEDFLALKKAYDTLIQAVVENYDSLKRITLEKENTSSAKIKSKEKTGDKIYYLYKKASEIYSEALEEYFEKAKQVNLDARDKTYKSLLAKLHQCKDIMAQIIKNDPGGIWTSDAIEKVASINIWIKNSTES